MEYLTAAALKTYRAENCPDSCPLIGGEILDPVVDHDHKTGNVRGVVSRTGNALLGKIENFYFSRCSGTPEKLPEVLRAMASYLEQEQGPLHPKGATQVTNRFAAKPKPYQVATLQQLGVPADVIDSCKNSQQRSKIYRDTITNKVTYDD